MRSAIDGLGPPTLGAEGDVGSRSFIAV
jgi:hypothetical protein